MDHSDEAQITALFDRIRREQQGRLDVLVNNAYAAVPFLMEYSHKRFYETDHKSPAEVWDLINNVGLRNHYICCSLATRMMIDRADALDSAAATPNTRDGLIINISSMGGSRYLFNTAYGVGK